MKIHYWEISIGWFGQFMLLLLFIPIVGCINEFGFYASPLLIIPIALMSMIDEVTIDRQRKVYRKGIALFGFISFSKWKSFENGCYLKIEPISEVVSLNSGHIDHGSRSKIYIALFIVDPSDKTKAFITQGKYKFISEQGVKLAEDLNLKIKDFSKQSVKG